MTCLGTVISRVRLGSTKALGTWNVADCPCKCSGSSLTPHAREFFGRASWIHPSPPDVQTLNAHFGHLDQEYASIHRPAPNGESIVELHERVRKALDYIVETLDNDPELPKTVLLCTHAATMIAAGRVLTGVMPEDPDEDDFQCFTAGLSKFVRKSDGSGKGAAGNFTCEMNSETSYLSGGAERGW